MPWRLEYNTGGAESRSIILQTGTTIAVGRDAAAGQAFDDSSMSQLHFAVSVSGNSLRLQNLSKTVVTTVNDELVEEILLQPGDQVKAGQTIFVVHAPAPSPYSSRIRIGGWGFESLPEAWDHVEGEGFYIVSADSFRANITAAEEPLPVGQTLRSYVETQMELARAQIPGIFLQGPIPLNIPGSDAALAVTIAIPDQKGFQVLQRQVYALSSEVVGVFTATVSESEPHTETVDAVVAGLSYFQG